MFYKNNIYFPQQPSSAAKSPFVKTATRTLHFAKNVSLGRLSLGRPTEDLGFTPSAKIATPVMNIFISSMIVKFVANAAISSRDASSAEERLSLAKSASLTNSF